MQSLGLPLFAYAEAQVAGRRVALFGRGASEAANTLVRFGARLVLAFDPDVTEAYDALRPAAITVRPLGDGDFDVRPGAFDLAIVLDVGDVAPLHRFLPRLRRVVSDDGAVLALSPRSSAGPTYEELFDLFSLQFEQVRMLAVLPFRGAAVVELGVDEPEVSVDTQLAGEAPAPDGYVVFASMQAVTIDSYMIVQLPEEAASAGASMSAAEVAKTAELSLRAQFLESALDDARGKLAEATRERESSPRLKDLEGEISQRDKRLEASEARAREYATSAQRLSLEVERLRELAAQRDAECKELRALVEGAKAPDPALILELEERAAKVAEADKRRKDVEKQLAVAEKAHASAEDRLADAQVRAHAAEAQLSELDGRAKGGDARLAELERKLAAAEAARHDADKRASAAELRAKTAESSATSASAAIAASEAQAKASMAAAEAAETKLTEAKAALAPLEATRARLAADVAESDAARAAELGALEAQLREQGARVKALDHEVARRERLVRELLLRQDLLPAAAPLPVVNGGGGGSGPLAHIVAEDLAPKLDKLSRELALAHGELQARAWRIQELEQARTKDRMHGLESELDALRAAFGQEHALRRRLESGEELEGLRAMVAEKSVLLEQLTRST